MPSVRGRVQDNIFIERLWWSLKYEYVYLRSFENGTTLRKSIERWFGYYNRQRPHQSLDDRTPDEVYYSLPPPYAEAA